MRAFNIAIVRVLFVTLTVLTWIAGPARGAADPAASTYQIDPAHDGAITFSKPFAPPLKLRWQARLGAPVSYPVVAGDLVIALANQNSLPMTAFDIATGKAVWRKPVSGGYRPGSYLASDNGNVFVATAFEPLQAFKASNGAFLWASKQFQPFSDFIPVAAYGYVYGAADGDGTTVYKLNEKDGATGWSYLLDGGGIGGTLADGMLYFPAPENVPGFVASSGGLAWTYSLGGDGGGGKIAAYYGGRLYAQDVNVIGGVILDGQTGKLLGGLGGTLTPAFYKQSIFSISGSSLVASDIGTGNILWYFTPPHTIATPPIVINGNVYSLATDGTLYINDGRNGKLLQSFKVCGGAMTDSQSSYKGLGAGQNTLFVPCGNVLAAFGP